MELDKNKFSLAAAATMGIVYVICAVLIAVWPDAALTLLGWMVHLVNVDKFAGDVSVTLGGFIIGLVQILLYTYLAAYIFALLHNRFSAQKGIS